MLAERQVAHYRTLNQWFQTPLGDFVANEFCTDLKQLSPHLSGELLLQLGHCGNNPWLKLLNFQHKWLASPFSAPESIQMESSLNQLPIDRNSLDCVVMPLTLEPFGGGNGLIDEIDRVLKPMGFVIFLCINPWSLWGGALKCGLLKCYADNKVQMRSPFNLNRTLIQRGYRQISLSNFCYIPPVNSQHIINKLTFLDEVGKMLWPFPSGFYCYIAQKYELIHPESLIQPISQTLAKEYKSPLQPAMN